MRRLVTTGVSLALLLCALVFAGVAQGETYYSDPPLKEALTPENMETNLSLMNAEALTELPEGVELTPEAITALAFIEAGKKARPSIARAILSQIIRLLGKTKTVVWEYLPDVFLVLGTGWVGYEIGGEVRGWFFDEGEELPGSSPSHVTEWNLIEPGQMLLSDKTGEIYAPDEYGWRGGDGTWTNGWVTNGPDCDRVIWGLGIRCTRQAGFLSAAHANRPNIAITSSGSH